MDDAEAHSASPSFRPVQQFEAERRERYGRPILLCPSEEALDTTFPPLIPWESQKQKRTSCLPLAPNVQCICLSEAMTKA